MEFNRAKKPALEGRAWTGRLNLSSISLFSFSELNKALDTNQYTWWRVLIFLITINSVRPILGLQYSIGNPTLSHVNRECENHSKRARLFWGLKEILGSNMIPLRTNLTHRRQLSLTEGESDFLPLPVFIRSKFSYCRHKKVFGDKSIVFLHFCENLGQASWPVINQLWFPESHFSANGISLRLSEVQIKIYERSLQALFSSAPRGFAARSRVLGRLASLVQMGEPARRLFLPMLG